MFNRTRAYILQNARRVCKAPAGDLAYPFIDPGAGYAGELWDWDSFFTAKGLLAAQSAFTENELQAAGIERAQVAEFIKGSVQNFLAAQEEDGYVPIMVASGGIFRGYFHGEYIAGTPLNQHKPFLCQAALQACKACGDYSWLDARQIAAYLEYYETRQFDERSGLFIWQDDIMIGIDNNPTVFYRPPRSCADIYLNSFMVVEYECAAELMRLKGLDGDGFEARAARLKEAINREMWDARDGIYYSQDVGQTRIDRKIGDFSFHEGLAPSWRTVPLKIRFWGCFLPLYAGICDDARAARLVEHFADPDVFAPCGIRTLARNEKMYDLSKSANPSNWLGAVWTVANYLIYKGLRRYNFDELAERLRLATCNLAENGLKNYGDLFESYHPDTGEPNLHPGFLSWNLLLIELLATE